MKFVFQGNGVSWRTPHLTVLKASISDQEVSILVELRDRDTGELREQEFTMQYNLGGKPLSSEDTLSLLRESYLKVVVHELDELLRIDNTWKDPHIHDPILRVQQDST